MDPMYHQLKLAAWYNPMPMVRSVGRALTGPTALKAVGASAGPHEAAVSSPFSRGPLGAAAAASGLGALAAGPVGLLAGPALLAGQAIRKRINTAGSASQHPDNAPVGRSPVAPAIAPPPAPAAPALSHAAPGPSDPLAAFQHLRVR
jgi:hypothetical protein